MQDPVIAESIKIAWTEGKAVGFIPWSLFIKDESGNLAYDDEVLFLQEFGFRSQAWMSIDEHFLPEATASDFYDALNAAGRWNYLKYAEAPQVADTVIGRLAEAGLSVEPGPEPVLKLVQDWYSFISYDDYMTEIQKQKEEEKRKKILRKARRMCSLCAADERLFKDGTAYYHRKDFGFVDCPARWEHFELKSDATAVPLPTEKKKAYKLLRGYLEHDNRLISSKRLIRSHTAYRKILEMGKEAVPFILNDLKEGRVGGIWTAEVLAELTGQRGGDPAWWLAWAEKERYLAES